MFLDFYGFREQPFGVTPDPRFVFETSVYREAWASLWYGIEANRGFMALIAEPGMGKTTLLFRLLEDLHGRTRTAFLFQTQCDSDEFLRVLLAELGCGIGNPASSVAGAVDRASMQDTLNQFLVSESQAGRPPVVVIDEAQALSDSVLETVRLLSNFETPQAKLLQIILAGQQELAEKLTSSHLTPLRQRISLVSRLAPLSADAVRPYVDHRLRVAGYAGPPLFSPQAYCFLAQFSGGVPRNINNLCFSALSLGCALRRRQIDVDLLREVEADLNWGNIVGAAQAGPGLTGQAMPAVAQARPTEIPIPVSQHAIAAPTGNTQLASPPPPSSAEAARRVGERAPIQASLAPAAQTPARIPEIPSAVRPTVAEAREMAVEQLRHALPITAKYASRVTESRRKTTAIAAACSVLIIAVLVLASRNELTRSLLASTAKTDAATNERTGGETVAGTSFSGTMAGKADSRVSRAGTVRGSLGHKSSSRSDTPPARSAHSAMNLRATSPHEQRDSFAADSTSHNSQAARTPPASTSNTHPSVAVAANEAPPLTKAIGPANASLMSDINSTPAASPGLGRAAPVTSQGVEPGKLLMIVKPQYPKAAKLAGVEGLVRLMVAVTKEGTVRDVRVVDGDPALAEAAVAAVKHWRYAPPYVGGRPIESEREITVKFTLDVNR